MAALNNELDPRLARAFGVFAGAIAFLVLYFFFASLGKLVPAHSDSSYLILYADAMLEGNWLLRGWDLTTVSFYTELPFYLVAVELMGVQPDLIRFVPAFIYALNVTLVLALIWKFRITGGYWIYLPAIAFLVLPSNGIWPMALNGAIHMATLTVGLFLLLALNDGLVVQQRSRSILLFGICLIGVWGDLAFAFFFLLPLLLAGLVLHRQDFDGMMRFLKSVAGPAFLGGLAGHLLILLARTMKWGAPVGNGVQRFEAQDMIVRKTQVLIDSWINFFGPDMWGMPLGIVSLAKVILGFGVVWWILATLRAWKDSDSGFDLFAAFMPFSITAAVVVSHHDGGGDETRLIVPAFFVAVVMMSRYAQRRVQSTLWKLAPAFALVAAFVVTVRLVTANHTLMAGDGYMSQFRSTAQLLKDRGLKQGFGDYWSTQVMRVASGNDLEITPLALVDDQGTATIWPWAADRRWFEQKTGRFVIVSGLHGETFQQRSFSRLHAKNLVGDFKYTTEWRDKSVRRASVRWGKPSDLVYFGELAILIYDQDITITDKELPGFMRPEVITSK